MAVQLKYEAEIPEHKPRLFGGLIQVRKYTLRTNGADVPGTTVFIGKDQEGKTYVVVPSH